MITRTSKRDQSEKPEGPKKRGSDKMERPKGNQASKPPKSKPGKKQGYQTK